MIKNVVTFLVIAFFLKITHSRQYRSRPAENGSDNSGLFNIRTVSKQCGNLIYTLDKDSFDLLDKNRNNFLSTYEIRKAVQIAVRHTSHQKRWLRLQHHTLIQAADLIRNILLKTNNSRTSDRVGWIDVITIDCDDLKFLDSFYRQNTVVRSRKDHYTGRSNYWPSKKFGSTAISQRQILIDFIEKYRKRNRY